MVLMKPLEASFTPEERLNPVCTSSRVRHNNSSSGPTRLTGQRPTMTGVMGALLIFVVCSLPLLSSSLSLQSRLDYDLVIVGAGASGLFASGVASSLGKRVLLLDTLQHLGGDCTNAACVPSKAVRSVARSLKRMTNDRHNDGLQLARQHAIDTVNAVRRREDPDAMKDYKNMNLIFCKHCRFVSSQEMEIHPYNETIPRKIRSKTFLIATGASPIEPDVIMEQAKIASLPIYSYRTILPPEVDRPSIWDLLNDTNKTLDIVIAGGGPTACELGQTLARLGGTACNVTIVAPGMLQAEDINLQRAAMQLLRDDNVSLCLGRKMKEVTLDRLIMLDDGSTLRADALILCLGRSPSVRNLGLDTAQVDWTPKDGILVHQRTLRSVSNPNVFACGDCCSAVMGNRRNAAHAAWTGYHAARNIAVPWILRVGATSVHANVDK
jgi:pyruvate/2-oxoglutarate dehydrogenase complex dihydrolipoamide dehydrogenase (E3) component